MWECIFRFGLGFGPLFGLYLIFNFAIGGTSMPNAVYAKQAEYAFWQAHPIWNKAGQLLLQCRVGPGLALAPGNSLVICFQVAGRSTRAIYHAGHAAA